MLPRTLRMLAAIGMLVALVASACSASVEITEVEPGPGGDPTDGDNGEVTVDADTPGASTAGGGDELDADEVYREIVDSVVFIEAGDATGTGIAIEGGWILTNAHVVERLAEVRIGASDGSDLGLYPVYSTDWLFDLALVGPVDEPSLVPFERTSSAELAIGDEVMLVGFPDEANIAPTPTLTSGIVSRRRRPALGDYPFVQVDATIAPGQSGGALIDADGRLMGISGLEFGLGEFGLVFEADVMWPRIDELEAAGPIDPFPTSNPVFTINDEVGPRRTLGFTMEVGPDGDAGIVAVSDADIYIDVLTATGFGYIEFPEVDDPFVVPYEAGEVGYFVDELLEGGEELDATLPPGTYQVIIGSFSEEPVGVTISSDNELRRFDDAEEGAELPVGEIVEGVIDWPRDSDRWTLPLEAGDLVTITADGIADTILAVRLDGVPIAASDDVFRGLFGTAAQVEFVAPETGDYEVEVGSLDDPRWGYLLRADLQR